jgi:hypothetical protein
MRRKTGRNMIHGTRNEIPLTKNEPAPSKPSWLGPRPTPRHPTVSSGTTNEKGRRAANSRPRVDNSTNNPAFGPFLLQYGCRSPVSNISLVLPIRSLESCRRWLSQLHPKSRGRGRSSVSINDEITPTLNFHSRSAGRGTRHLARLTAVRARTQ